MTKPASGSWTGLIDEILDGRWTSPETGKKAVVPYERIVIEDSPAGIQAARAAGMTVFAFTGGSHTVQPAYRQQLAALAPDATFDAMTDLLHLVDRYGK